MVGVGGSSPSSSALAFAFRAAAQRGTGLTAVHVRPPATDYVVDELAPPDGDSMSIISTMLGRARAAFPWVEVQARCLRGTATEVLISESGSAALLVIGTRERGLLRRRVFGSVSRSIIERARCPVAVIH